MPKRALQNGSVEVGSTLGWASVQSDGTLLAGTPRSVNRSGAGRYEVLFSESDFPGGWTSSMMFLTGVFAAAGSTRTIYMQQDFPLLYVNIDDETGAGADAAFNLTIEQR